MIKVIIQLVYIPKKQDNWYFITWDIRRIAIKKINFSEPAINYLNKRTIVINLESFNADLINKQFLKKSRKIEFDLISKDRNKIKIVKKLI